MYTHPWSGQRQAPSRPWGTVARDESRPGVGSPHLVGPNSAAAVDRRASILTFIWICTHYIALHGLFSQGEGIQPAVGPLTEARAPNQGPSRLWVTRDGGGRRHRGSPRKRNASNDPRTPRSPEAQFPRRAGQPGPDFGPRPA
jgi:hypothetical protein